MWLLILALAAALVTPIWYSMAHDDKYMLKLLCLLLWGATIMVFIDHLVSFLIEGGEFFEITADAAALGFSMLTVALVIWETVLLLKDPRGVLYKRRDS